MFSESEYTFYTLKHLPSILEVSMHNMLNKFQNYTTKFTVSAKVGMMQRVGA